MKFQKVPWIKCYPGLSLHQKISNRGIMEQQHLMSETNMSLEMIRERMSKNEKGYLKTFMRQMFRKTGHKRFLVK